MTGEILGLNTSPERQLIEFGNRTDLTIKWVLQLVMAIECDTFVGTRGVSLYSALVWIVLIKEVWMESSDRLPPMCMASFMQTTIP